jgi:TPR repeat protein
MPRKSRPRKTGLRKTKPGERPDSQANLSTTLGATLHELCCYLAAASVGQANQDPLSEEECAALAAAALDGHAEAEFLVGSVFDAAHDPARALEWYRRSARGDFAPAKLQLSAER